MPRRLLAALLLVASTQALALTPDCPPGSFPRGEPPPGQGETWCELIEDATLLHGPYRAWHPNGVLGAEENYIRGKAEGRAAYRWASGQRQAEGNFKNGLPDGWWNFWDKTGTPAGRVLFKDGHAVSGRLPKWALDWDRKPLARHPVQQPEAAPQPEPQPQPRPQPE